MTATDAQRDGRSPEFDVAVIGSGLAASALAAVLARADLRVVIIDAGHHPRFAIGESMTPQAATLLRAIADRYDVPELSRLAAFDDVNSAITTSCGVKRNDGFLYHRPGQRQRLGEAHQAMIGAQTHLFRQDIDAWLTNVAVSYGAVLRQRIKITDVDIDGDGVTLTDGRGQSWRARYVVDASDEASPLATAFGLREEPTRLRHRSRPLVTHMIGVTPYDQIPSRAAAAHGQRAAHGEPSPWRAGTLHHVFEGGWLWVIPFNNHPRATNRVTSVGLSLDPRSGHADADGAPGDEFRAFIGRFPDIARQFADAQEIRPWASSGPAQYSSRATVGPRWCVTGRAAGFVDTLFSRDLTNSLAVVSALAGRLLEAAAADDFSADRFAEVERIEQASLDLADDLVASSYTAFRDYGLWDAWFRVWSVAELFSIREINRTYAAYAQSRNPAQLRLLDERAPEGWLPGQARSLLSEASRLMRAVAEGGEDPASAETAIRQAVSAAEFVPPAARLAGPAGNWVELGRSGAQSPAADGSSLAGKIRHAVAARPAARRRQGSYSRAGH